jgi:hypothetical protein
MVYGRWPQVDPHLPSYTFTYATEGDERCRAITVAAPTAEAALRQAAAEAALRQAAEELDRWHGAGRWGLQGHEARSVE